MFFALGLRVVGNVSCIVAIPAGPVVKQQDDLSVYNIVPLHVEINLPVRTGSCNIA